MNTVRFATVAAAILLLSATCESLAGDANDLPAAYRRAEEVQTGRLAAKARNLSPVPVWDARSERFWYERQDVDGSTYMAVDPDRRTQAPAFDASRLASELTRVAGHAVDAKHLPLGNLTIDASARTMAFTLDDKPLRCQLDTYRCELSPPAAVIALSVASPDGSRVIVAKDNNLVLREVKSGAERVLTRDGEAYFAYGRMPDSGLLSILRQSSGMEFSPFGIQWSPDGKHLVVTRVDERALPEYHFLQSVPYDQTLRPKLLTMHMALSAEPFKPVIEVSIIDPETGRKARIDCGPDGLSRTLWWTADNGHFLAIQGEDYSRKATLFDIDVASGAARKVFEEDSQTFFQISPLEYDEPAVRFLPKTHELVWYSQRDGWGHLYLLDVKRGTIKAQLGKGPWSIQNIVALDEARRLLYFTAVGREKGENPYYRHLYSVRLDGSGLRRLTPAPGDHDFPPVMNAGIRDVMTALGLKVSGDVQMMSPAARYFVDTVSTVDSAPRSVLRAADGREVMALAQADVSALQAAGWVAPEEVHGLAADGKTDLYGLVYKPAGFDPGQRYAVVECIYNGPQVVTTPHNFKGGINAEGCGEIYAQLGFVSFVMDGRGTPLRSKAFQDYMYGNMQEFSLEDHVAFLKQLAGVRPYLDLDRLGVVGHSFGGFTSMKAILGYPDFYKAAVSSAGPYNMYGMYPLDAFFPPPTFEGGAWSATQRPTNWGQVDLTQQASRLKGKLLIGYGDLDENAYPASTAQMVNALIAANKEFDLVYLPNRSHAFAREPYFVRRSWDFFMRNLLHQEPPKDYLFQPAH